MKELNNNKLIHLDEFDIDVDKYITTPIIELIGDEMMKFDKYTEREYVKDISILRYCTSIGEDIEKYDYEQLKYNGVIDSVYMTIKNSIEIDVYVDRQESVSMQIKDFLKNLTVLIDKYGKNLPKNLKDFDFKEAMNALNNAKK